MFIALVRVHSYWLKDLRSLCLGRLQERFVDGKKDRYKHVAKTSNLTKKKNNSYTEVLRECKTKMCLWLKDFHISVPVAHKHLSKNICDCKEFSQEQDYIKFYITHDQHFVGSNYVCRFWTMQMNLLALLFIKVNQHLLTSPAHIDSNEWISWFMFVLEHCHVSPHLLMD